MVLYYIIRRKLRYDPNHKIQNGGDFQDGRMAGKR